MLVEMGDKHRFCRWGSGAKAAGGSDSKLTAGISHGRSSIGSVRNLLKTVLCANDYFLSRSALQTHMLPDQKVSKSKIKLAFKLHNHLSFSERSADPGHCLRITSTFYF
jgi:hypothetical protein